MNELLERLFAEKDGKWQIVNEIQKAVEAEPAAWYPELKAACRKARRLSNVARQAFNDAGEDVAICEAHSQGLIPDEYDSETRNKFLIEAKARAWDLYWELRSAESMSEALYEQLANAEILLANPDYKPVEATIATEEDEFPF